MAETTSVLSLQGPKDVSVADVEQELAKIWQAYGENAAARATTFNLVMFEPNSAQGQRLVSIDAIASQSPCRVIDLVVEAGEDQGISAQVAAYCPLQKTRSALICGEYVTLRGTLAAFERVRGLLPELLAPELPTFLWWGGSPDPAAHLFQRALELSDRLVFDSTTFVDEEAALLYLKSEIDQGRVVADLNWRRLQPWQELTAQAFDPPDRRAAVWDIDGITIDYEKGNSAQALMFLGWIASRLGWEPVARQQEGGDYNLQHIRFQGKDGQEIKAELAAIPLADPGAVIGDLIGLRLSSAKSNTDACNIFCSEATGCMRMEASGGAQSYRTHQVTPLAEQSADSLLPQQLRRWGRETLYEESLGLTAKILNLP